jgi:RND family efflux transporter MFP subunit
MIRIALAMAALLLIASCSRTGDAAKVAPASETPIVAVGKVTRANLSSNLTLTAEFEPFQEVDLMAKVSGYIRQIKVDIGDRVREGQVLTVLEIPEMQDDLTRAAASIEEAQAELATARDDLQRAQSAHEAAHSSYARVLDVSRREPGLVPQQEVDEVHSRDLVAEAQISAARSHVSAGEQRIHVAQADQARLKTVLQYATITAPFAGVVTRRYTNTGSLVQAGTSSQATPVVRLSENGLLRLALPVPESAVPQVRLGGTVDVRVPALHRSFPGKVARFSDKVDESTRTMKTEVDVPNADLVLVPGMYAEVDLITERRIAAFAVPVEAVDVVSGSGRVLVVAPSGAIRVVPVVTGIETAQQIEIRSGDLQEGDLVVIGSRAGLKNGDQVRTKF